MQDHVSIDNIRQLLDAIWWIRENLLMVFFVCLTRRRIGPLEKTLINKGDPTSRKLHPTKNIAAFAFVFHTAEVQSSASSTVCMVASISEIAWVSSQLSLRTTDATSVTGAVKHSTKVEMGISVRCCCFGVRPKND